MNLVITSGPTIGQSFEGHQGRTRVVGRSEKAGVKIEALLGSRIHMEIANSRDGILAADRGSSIAGGTRPSAPDEIKPLTQMVGEKLGPCNLQSIIGNGSSGVVFKAYDLLEKDPANRIQTPSKLISELLRTDKFNNLVAGS